MNGALEVLQHRDKSLGYLQKVNKYSPLHIFLPLPYHKTIDNNQNNHENNKTIKKYNRRI